MSTTDVSSLASVTPTETVLELQGLSKTFPLAGCSPANPRGPSTKWT